MANLIHLSQVKGGVKLAKDLETVMTSYDAIKVLTDIAKGEGGEGNYNVNELLTALKEVQDKLIADVSTEGSIDQRIQLAKDDIQGKIDAINNKKVKDRVRITGRVESDAIKLQDGYEALVPNLDTATEYVVYGLDNKAIQKEDGTPLKYSFVTSQFDGTPSKVTEASMLKLDEVPEYEPIAGDFDFKLFPVGEFKFAELPTDYLLDNDEMCAAHYQQAIDEIVVNLVANKELIEAIKALVGTESVQQQIQKVIDTLRADLASELNGKGASLIGIEDAGAVFTATTVEGALAEIDARLVELKAQQDAEADRALAAEKVLEDAITAEKDRAEAKELELQGAIDTEKGRAEAAELALQQAITAEQGRAEAKELELEQAIAAEQSRAEAAEQGLQGAIDDLEDNLATLSAVRTVEQKVLVTEGQTEIVLDFTPSAEGVAIEINGITYKEVAGAISVNREAKTVTWLATAELGGFDLMEEFSVIAVYKTSEQA